MNNSDELKLQIHPRDSESVSLQIPIDTLASLRKIAERRDMSLAALVKFYIGQGLRQDLASVFSEHILENTAQVLAKHVQSEEEVSTILQEIQASMIR